MRFDRQIHRAIVAAVAAIGFVAAAQADPVRVLVVTGGHAFQAKPFSALFDSIPDIKYQQAEHPKAQDYFAPEKAGEYDVIVLYDMLANLPAKSRQDLKKLLDGGKGLVVLHHAIADYQNWDEFVDVIGATYVLDESREVKGKKYARPTYKHDVTVNVQVVDKNHPVTKGVGDFSIYDEVYKGYYLSPTVHPLLKTDHPASGELVGWTNKYAGREVVYLQLGHGPEAYANESFRKLLGNAIHFVAGQAKCQASAGEEGFVPLFNGKNLDGWVHKGSPEGWVIRDGILHSDAGKNGYWIRTEKKYSDFILKVDWKISPGGNSGVFFRAADEGHPWLTGYEVQISNEQPPRDDPHCTGALYGYVAVNPRPDESPNVWRSFEIQAIGKHMVVLVDGKKMVDANQEAVDAIKAKPMDGYIGLQDSHGGAGTTVEYRNVKIKDLSKR